MTGVAATVATNWPSIDDVQPEEQGGPTARTGLNYQDEIAVSLLLDMLTDAFFVKIHCETHDDIVAIRSDDAHVYAEYVQVKASEPNKLWTVADLCAGSAGSSIFEKSLGRDGCREISRFRLVTLRPVASDLKLLTYPCYGTGREPCSDGFLILAAELKRRFPNTVSKKGNGVDYWVIPKLVPLTS
jgi:hypothetical protein